MDLTDWIIAAVAVYALIRLAYMVLTYDPKKHDEPDDNVSGWN